MAGYSGTTLTKKLGIKPGHRVAVLRGSAGTNDLLGDLPSGVVVTTRLTATACDVVILFVKNAHELRDKFGPAAQGITTAGGLWVAWPKKSSGVVTDLNDAVVRELGLSTGLVDNKVCAIDETWSGLRFVVRVKDRSSK